MSEIHEPQSSSTSSDSVPFEVVSKPSSIIKTFQRIITIDGKSYELMLVTMRSAFNQTGEGEDTMSEETLVQSFMNENPPLKGLSLALGEHSTCLIASENPLASTSLASRLSKKFNLNGPVYVASDIQVPHDTCDLTDVMSQLYLKIFQFVGSNYRVNQVDDIKISGGDK